MDTIKPDGLQFLTFKLSFNDYYAQDISNKIKSVKQRKIEKGEYQAGIPPYGYKKDSNRKNHLIPDEYSSKIVKEIFNMYVNKGMSTIKIADELNKKEILPPAMYLKIPTYMKKNSVNPSGKYVWLRAQIGKILKNEVYLGHVVGRKFQKVSHKIAKVRCTKKEEHIVLKNMHEPIIDLDTWNKAQQRLSRSGLIRERKNEHPLKGLVYCGECGNKATIRYREEKRKNGSIWKATYFICSKRNNYTGLCTCKQISSKIIEDIIYDRLRNEFKKINFSEVEIKQIYKEAKQQSIDKDSSLKVFLENLEEKKIDIEKKIEEIYVDKINKILQPEDFKIIYEKMYIRRQDILKQIKEINEKMIEISRKKIELDYKKMKEMLDIIIELKNPEKLLMEKLINKISFNKNRELSIRFEFKK